MWGSLVLIIAAFSASNARMMAERNAANQTAPVPTSANQTAAVPTATNQTAANKTSLSQADPSYRLQAAANANAKDYSFTFTIENTTYHYVRPGAAWSTARSKCLDLGAGADLALILSYKEFDQVAKKLLAPMHKVNAVWLGARRLGTAGTGYRWHWLRTGEPLSPKFRKWYNSYDRETKRPSKAETCQAAFMRYDGDYLEGNGPSIDCTAQSTALPYLCEIPAEES